MPAQTCNAAGARAPVAEKLRRLGRVQLRLEGLQSELNAQLEDVRRRYDRRIAALQRGETPRLRRRKRAALAIVQGASGNLA